MRPKRQESRDGAGQDTPEAGRLKDPMAGNPHEIKPPLQPDRLTGKYYTIIFKRGVYQFGVAIIYPQVLELDRLSLQSKLFGDH